MSDGLEPDGGPHGDMGRRTRRRVVTLHGERVGFWESAPEHLTALDPHPDHGRAGTSGAGRQEEVVVLVHGIAGSAHTWGPVLAAFARRRDPRRVIVPDLVGHGTSSAPWADYSLGGYATGLRDLLAALGHHHATVIGHSLGGGVAQQFALQFPEHCDRLVLVSSGGLGREVSPVLRAATLPGAEWVLPLLTEHHVLDLAAGVAHQLADRLPGLHRLRGSVAEAARSFASLGAPEHRRAFLHTARSVLDPGGQRVQASSRLYLTEGLPTLIVWGEDDTMIPVAHAHRAHELIPHSRLAILPGAGHFPHDDHPEQFSDLLLDFLDDTTPARRTLAEHAALIAAHTDLYQHPSSTSDSDSETPPVATALDAEVEYAHSLTAAYHRALAARVTWAQATGLLAQRGATSTDQAEKTLRDHAARHGFVPAELAPTSSPPASTPTPSWRATPSHARPPRDGGVEVTVQVTVSHLNAVGLAAVGCIEPITAPPWRVRTVRVVEPTVAQVIEEMLEDLDQTTATAEDRSPSAPARRARRPRRLVVHDRHCRDQ